MDPERGCGGWGRCPGVLELGTCCVLLILPAWSRFARFGSRGHFSKAADVPAQLPLVSLFLPSRRAERCTRCYRCYLRAWGCGRGVVGWFDFLSFFGGVNSQ